MKTLNGHTKQVLSLVISNEGQLISGSADTTIKVWNISTGENLITLNGHTSWVYSLAISKEGHFIS